MLWKGVILALTAAVVMTAIDTLRKTASSHGLPVSSLVCLVALLDAIISCSFVGMTGGFRNVHFTEPKMFTMAVLCSSALLMLAKFMYQQALSISQLSMTVPYLSFTPTFLVATAYLFIGEEPTIFGLIGISIVTAGGYLLSRQDHAPSNSSTAGAPSLPVTRTGTGLKRSGTYDSGGGGLTSWLGLDPAPLPPSSRPLYLMDSAGSNGESTSLQHIHSVDDVTRCNSRSLQELANLDPTNIKSVVSAGVGSSLLGVKALAARPGRSGTTTPELEAAALDAQASGGGPMGLLVNGGGAAAGGGGALKAHPSGGKATGMFKGWDSGTGMMMAVAAVWSITASLDKLGVLHAPSVWVYFALQRLVIGVASCVYLVCHAPHAFKLLLTRNLRLLVLISLCETLAVVLFLEAIRYLFVSYVVAIKRCNILLSVLLGGLIFREKIAHRLPYIFLMLAGMTLIVLDPDSSTVHTTSHA